MSHRGDCVFIDVKKINNDVSNFIIIRIMQNLLSTCHQRMKEIATRICADASYLA